MKKFEITEELALKILQYLDTKPYGEVVRLIAEIQQIKPIEIDEEVKGEIIKRKDGWTSGISD